MSNRVYGASAAIFLFTAYGCATATKVIGPDGTEHQLLSCNIIERCYEEAREVCGGSYKIVNTSSEVSGSGGDASTRLKLLVKCEKSPN